MQKNSNGFARMFAHRTGICFFIVMFLFLTCVLRVAVIATGSYAEAQTKQSSYRIGVASLRGTIFDCNMAPITNNGSKTVAAVLPTPRGVVSVSSLLSGDSLETVLSRLSSGKPAVCDVVKKVECDSIAYTTVYTHNTADLPAVHAIGYVDSSGHGVSGLEAAYDDLLYSDKTVDAVFTIDGRGKVLEGAGIKIENDTSVVSNGLISTLDLNLQDIAEQAAQQIKKGAVVVCEASTGKIRAMVSRPTYDCTNVSASLTADDSPLMNRATTAYNVGSIFKPCVAAAALENGKANFSVTCTGSTQIIDRVFKCHKLDGHGFVTLREALAYSCNVFFYNFAIHVGARGVYDMASSLGFGERLKIADGMYTAPGSLTSLSALSNDAELANLSIGQGKLLLTPISMLPLYCAIASDGTYRIPSLVEGTVSGGSIKHLQPGSPTRVMTAEHAALLREYLAGVITMGTGKAAAPTTCTAAGKTATAQTGRYVNGVEISHSWFCGFFPAQSPQYVVVVFAENSSGNPAKVFAQIADGITGLGTNKGSQGNE